MRTITLSLLLLVCGVLGIAQDSAEQVDKAPPAIDEALRARVDLYYKAFLAGKFKEAYALVADDSQDAFLQADKAQYKVCETIKTRYSDNFTKATVVESCKGDWYFHGAVATRTYSLTTTWKIVDDKWFWFYVRPTQAPNPFSPTGFIPVPSTESVQGDVAHIPKDMRGAATNILSKITLDKPTVHLLSDQTSKDVIHVHNGMPGVINLAMDQLAIPGLTITIGKSELGANEDTTVTFEYNLDSKEIACVDCAKKIKGTPFAALHVIPTGQIFNISIFFGPVASTHHFKVPASPQQ
jgi:hypothetical protein